MSEIPKSHWVVEKEWFKAKPVVNFSQHYKEWLLREDGFLDGDDDLDKFLSYIEGEEFIFLYEHPCANDVKDYFEKKDDNHVIPRCLFTLAD